MKKTIHLKEDQLIQALVSADQLSHELKHHLDDCPSCRAELEQVMADLDELGRLARATAPARSRQVEWNTEDVRVIGRERKSWPLALGAAAAALAAILLFVPPHLDPDEPVPRAALSAAAEEQLLAEADRMAENSLSAFQQFVIADSDPVLDDEFMEFMFFRIETI
jgi:hypothetical protein